MVRFGYQVMAFLGDESVWAAEAAECAGDQNKYWEYHDKLFASQNGENEGAFAKDKLKQFAAELQLDTAQFNACLDSGKYTAQVEADTQENGNLGVQSTPAFLVNTQAISGAQPFDTFSKVIESEKSKK